MLYGIALVASALMAAVCVGIHYEAMRWLGRWMAKARARRQGVIVVVVGLLASHVVEIWLFAGIYTLLAHWPDLGTIEGAGATFMDFVYYSSVVFTTLGFGDMVPSGAIRMITGTEALVGFGLLTWSASFTFLEMQRFWPASGD